jgi:hypothetical protein
MEQVSPLSFCRNRINFMLATSLSRYGLAACNNQAKGLVAGCGRRQKTGHDEIGMQIMQRIARLLGLGKQRYHRGYDLQGNSYYELPNPNSHLPKRTIEYKVQRHLSEYRFEDVTPQWTAWLRHTRNDPPSLDVRHAITGLFFLV